MAQQMKAVLVDRFGPSSVLSYREVPVPEPGDDEALVRVHAVSVNRTLDLRVRENGDGRSVTLPLVLGVDPTGTVERFGPDVSGIRGGDRVAVVAIACGSCPACLRGTRCERRFHPGVEQWGGYAEYVRVPAWSLVKIPDDLAFKDATVILRHYPTAHHLLAEIADVRPGERVLVLGCAGGLGSAAVEVARRLGAKVIAGAGADVRVEAGLALGADSGVNYREEDLASRVSELTEGRGVDVLVDNIGEADLWSRAFACLGTFGRLVTAGAHGGGVVPLDVRLLYQRRLSVFGSAGRSLADLDWVLDEVRRKPFHPLIGAVLPLSQAKKAHDLVAANAITGKIILDPTLG